MLNKDPNYLSWTTNLMVFNGQTLDMVVADLKKVYNIDIVADNPDILTKNLTATYDKEPQDTIIRLICATFNLGYKREGNLYHLSKK